ncbi:kynureninase [Pseudaquabacterium pictum]|uniref:Kynureninase n=1 Tax=Pseudaquabacterium pictum TaxID=2315236 RepID=A0A480AY16_9BURK|nr:kynureninase [Rubrivivax pictus]GCL65017.1 kynureninase [Rubrivivax pictus]
MTTRHDALALDADDALAPLRQLFQIPDGLVYLDGNSLGVLPRATATRVAQVVSQEWGEGLIGSWNAAGWMALPQQIGDKIAPLVGVGAGELVVADSTSVNLFKVLSAALALQRAADPARTVVVSERSNFPTDLYIAESLGRQHGCTLHLVDRPEDIPAALGPSTAVLMLTQVNYRNGRLHDMAALSAAAHAAGALTVWDLAHSAGAVPVALAADGADFAVGCGYKYLNGGPGAPAFCWAHPRHASQAWQPLAGWHGHAAPFAFEPGYQPAPGITRYLCGTPPVLAMAALECGVDTLLAARPLGGMAAIRAKSLALTRLFIDLVQQRCGGHGLQFASPDVDAQRGSQVCLAFSADSAAGQAGAAFAVVQALIARRVVGDFRAGDAKDGLPDILRFGVTPLYTRFADVWDAVEQLRQVLETGEWREARFNQRGVVT